MSSERRLVDIDGNGISEFAHFDSDGKLIGIEWEEDVEAILEENKRRQNDGTKGFSKSREWQHTASIPPIFMIKWAIQKGVPPQVMNSREGLDEIALKMTKDPDYRFLRTDI